MTILFGLIFLAVAVGGVLVYAWSSDAYDANRAAARIRAAIEGDAERRVQAARLNAQKARGL